MVSTDIMASTVALNSSDFELLLESIQYLASIYMTLSLYCAHGHSVKTLALYAAT